MVRKNSRGEVNDYQLALISRSVFDIGPRTRIIIFMFGLIGIAMAFMASLASGKHVELDKIIHFSGYSILSATFILALRPVFYVPALLGIVAMSVGIEFLQRLTGRSFDVDDMVANAIGVSVGGLVGLIIRGVYALISKEVAAQRARRKLIQFDANEILVREGDPIDDMYIIKKGRVAATRLIDGKEVGLTTGVAGDVLGVLSVVEGKPQYATLQALEPTEVYCMDLKELMASTGGSELPVSLVLTGLSKKIRQLADQILRDGNDFDADGTIA